MVCLLGGTVYSVYSGHVYSGHSDIVAIFPGTKYIYSTVHLGYSGHLGPLLSGHYIRLATISDLNIIEQMYFVPGKVATISEWPL